MQALITAGLKSESQVEMGRSEIKGPGSQASQGPRAPAVEPHFSFHATQVPLSSPSFPLGNGGPACFHIHLLLPTRDSGLSSDVFSFFGL